MPRRTLVVCALTLLAGAASAAPVDPQSWTVVNPAPGSELGHAAILQRIYGGTFTASNFTGGANMRGSGTTTVAETFTGAGRSAGITLTRVRDRGGSPGPLDVFFGSHASGQNDQVWRGNRQVTLQAKAKYAADNSVFGWRDNTTGAMNDLMNTRDFSRVVTTQLGSDVTWYLNDLSTRTVLWSDERLNTARVQNRTVTLDQMVTYQVEGLRNGKRTWLLFWEDRLRTQHSDYDYNDAVIEITAVPLPAPAAAAAMGLVAMMAVRRRRA